MHNFFKFSLSIFLLSLSVTLFYFMLNGGLLRASEPQMLRSEGTYQYQMQTTLDANNKFRFEVLVWNTSTGESAWYYFDNYQTYSWLKESKQIPAVDF